jgi:CubicO group peptidase (beta-lactamase class C family)
MLRLLLSLLSIVVALLDSVSAKTCSSRSSIEQSLLDVHIPGAVIMIVNATDILYQEAFGHQSLSPVKMMDVDKSIFVLASISKTFIAVAVMQLVETNRLDLDTDINQYLSFPNQRISHPQYPSHAITLRQLLSHSASIGVNDATGLTLMGTEDNALTGMSLADVCFTYLNHNASNWLPKPPGTVALYSNVGASLAGLVVERVTKMPYEHYVREKILKPLGIELKKAGFRLSDIENREELVKHYAFNVSYLKDWNRLLPQLNVTEVNKLRQLIKKSFKIYFRVLSPTGLIFHSIV